MEQMKELNQKIKEMAGRIRELREIEGLTATQMAEKTGVTEQEYLSCEQGEKDLNFAFIYRCANALNVNVTEIIEGYSPKLRGYTVTRNGSGQKIAQAHGMTYFNLAYAFQNRIAEPLYVRSVFSADAESKPIELTTHAGQECDIVVDGYLKVQIGSHTEILGPGDSIYYDSDVPHGMIAVNGKDCIFYAIVLNPTGEPIPELAANKKVLDFPKKEIKKDDKQREYQKFIDVVEDADGTPTSITFKNEDKFNFAFDLVDALAKREPDKLAMLHISKDKNERRFTFKDIKKESARCANYFKSLGIKKGDRVMLVLKRHYQFWFAMIGLNKLGAIAIPATNQLQEHDFEYRFKSAGVSAIICTADGDTAHQVEIASKKCPDLKHMMMVNGNRDGWRNFDEEYSLYSTHFNRTADSPCGDDPLLMFFTSGTSGYPKIATHNHKYPFGHFHTAK